MALTEVRRYRPGSEAVIYNALTYAEAIAGFPTIKPGDIIRVNSSGLTYVASDNEELTLMGSLRNAKGARAVSFQHTESEALADTDAALIRVCDGVRIHGQGLADTDSGAVWTDIAGGMLCQLTTTNEAAHLVALSFGTDTEAYAPASFGPMSVEATVAMDTALTDRAMFLGFAAPMIDALDPIVTGSTTVITLVNDDLVGLYYDSGLTDADRIYFAANKANGAASENTTGDGVDTGTDFPTAGTYVRLRVTVDAAGNAKAYVNGNLVSSRALTSTAATALNPVLYVESNAAAVKIMNVKEFYFASEA